MKNQHNPGCVCVTCRPTTPDQYRAEGAAAERRRIARLQRAALRDLVAWTEPGTLPRGAVLMLEQATRAPKKARK